MALSTIMDVGFIVLFPKPLLPILNQYAKDIRKSDQENDEFLSLINNLVTAFLYRPITIQKVIQMLISRKKTLLNSEEQEKRPSMPNNETCEHPDSIHMEQNSSVNNETMPNTPQVRREMCGADKCRLLKAKGIIRRPMYCSNRRCMCSGCISKSLRHRKVDQKEQAVRFDSSPNQTLAQIDEYIYTPISISISSGGCQNQEG